MPARRPNPCALGVAATIAMIITVVAQPARASDLSYTYLDFQALDNDVDAAGSQRPVPSQLVNVASRGGDGIAVAGSLGLPGRLYASGAFTTSIIDITGVVESPLTRVTTSDSFDLVSSQIGIGYQREISDNFDVIAELTYESIDYDFGSVAGENFDVSDSGLGAEIGFRWNPKPAFELFATGRVTPVGKVDLNARELDSDTLINTGVRWYFFNDLGVGVDYSTGEVKTFTVSLRFGFGNLPW
jgi:hypothetical protein